MELRKEGEREGCNDHPSIIIILCIYISMLTGGFSYSDVGANRIHVAMC